MDTTEITTPAKTFNYQGHDYEVVEVHISDIIPRDTVIHKGEIQTVCYNNISHCSFMGKSIFGDNYWGGTRKVQKVLLEDVWRKKQENLCGK